MTTLVYLVVLPVPLHSTTMLLGGLWPLLFLWISIVLLSAGSLTPVPTLGSQGMLLDPEAPRCDSSHWPHGMSC